MREFFTALIAELRTELGTCGEDHGTEIGVRYPFEGFADVQIAWWDDEEDYYSVIMGFEGTTWVWVESSQLLSVRLLEQLQKCVSAVVEAVERGEE